MTTTSPVGRVPRLDPAWFTLAWYAVLLAVVFTTAFWLGRVLGPDGAAPDDRPPDHAPHAASR
jgi:hypothetical protein